MLSFNFIMATFFNIYYIYASAFLPRKIKRCQQIIPSCNNELFSPVTTNYSLPVTTVILVTLYSLSGGRANSKFILAVLTRAGPELRNFRGKRGGGVYTPPPHLTRLLGVVGRNGKKRPKTRQIKIRNCFSQFFAKVNIGVTRGHPRSNDKNVFFR